MAFSFWKRKKVTAADSIMTGEEAKPSEVEPQEKAQETDSAKSSEESGAKSCVFGNTGGGPMVNGTSPTSGSPAPKTKTDIRTETWSKLESADLVLFPRPCAYRIPRFKGENEAVEKLAEMDIFKNAKVVKVNLDKAHERLRLEVIQSKKELVAGTPGLREAVFLLMHPPVEPNRMANKMAASRMGIHHLGTALDFSSDTKADLVVLGSVAVDKKGHRIGKGEGFSDLEYALLSKLGAIAPNAAVATLVHDAQVYDEFPESMFKPYDVPVDVIITPTQVINVENKLPKPTLQWNLLSKRRVNDIPIIKQLMEKEQINGTNVELKEVDSDTEGGYGRFLPMLRRRRFMKLRRQASAPVPRGQPRARGGGGGDGGQSRRESSAPPPARGTRTFRRRPRRLPSTSADSPKADGQPIGRPMRRGPLRRINKPRYTVDFSIRVNGLTSSVRIRDLKAALIERGVRPSDISWRATKGVALLHFAKRRQQTQEPDQSSNGIDQVVASLQGLSVKSEDGPAMNLSVEPAKPIATA